MSRDIAELTETYPTFDDFSMAKMSIHAASVED